MKTEANNGKKIIATLQNSKVFWQNSQRVQNKLGAIVARSTTLVKCTNVRVV